MTIKSTTKFFALGGFLAWLIGSVSKNINGIKDSLSFGRITSSGVSPTLNTVTFNLAIDVVNGSDTALPFDSFDGNLFFGENNLSRVLINNPVVIQSMATTSVPLAVEVRYTDVPISILNIIQSGNFLNELRLRGNIRSGILSIPIDRKLI